LNSKFIIDINILDTTIQNNISRTIESTIKYIDIAIEFDLIYL